MRHQDRPRRTRPCAAGNGPGTARGQGGPRSPPASLRPCGRPALPEPAASTGTCRHRTAVRRSPAGPPAAGTECSAPLSGYSPSKAGTSRGRCAPPSAPGPRQARSRLQNPRIVPPHTTLRTGPGPRPGPEPEPEPTSAGPRAAPAGGAAAPRAPAPPLGESAAAGAGAGVGVGPVPSAAPSDLRLYGPSLRTLSGTGPIRAGLRPSQGRCQFQC